MNFMKRNERRRNFHAQPTKENIGLLFHYGLRFVPKLSQLDTESKRKNYRNEKGTGSASDLFSALGFLAKGCDAGEEYIDTFAAFVKGCADHRDPNGRDSGDLEERFALGSEGMDFYFDISFMLPDLETQRERTKVLHSDDAERVFYLCCALYFFGCAIDMTTDALLDANEYIKEYQHNEDAKPKPA